MQLGRHAEGYVCIFLEHNSSARKCKVFIVQTVFTLQVVYSTKSESAASSLSLLDTLG